MLEKFLSDGTAEINGRTGTKSQASLNPMSMLLINTDASLFWILIFCAKKRVIFIIAGPLYTWLGFGWCHDLQVSPKAHASETPSQLHKCH